MCDYNTGCPGRLVGDGFIPCESKETCASGVETETPDVVDTAED